MRKFRKLGLSLVLAATLVMVLAVPAMAANPTVSLTVTAEVVSITNDKDTWAIGIVAVDAVVYFSTDGTQDDDWSTITNTGSVAVDVEIQGTNFLGTPNWTLAATTGADQYSLYANKQATPTVYDVEVKTSAYVDIVTSLAADGTNKWSMKFTAPSSFGGTEDGNQKTATVTLVASKS